MVLEGVLQSTAQKILAQNSVVRTLILAVSANQGSIFD